MRRGKGKLLIWSISSFFHNIFKRNEFNLPTNPCVISNTREGGIILVSPPPQFLSDAQSINKMFYSFVLNIVNWREYDLANQTTPLSSKNQLTAIFRLTDPSVTPPFYYAQKCHSIRLE